ncbi:MAG: anion permease [Acidobacteriota bacterium]|jgi:citrate:succinate antiporter/L-tartrate/succinate antiporter|nr:anion permease [Acidobacteriota bacterium]
MNKTVKLILPFAVGVAVFLSYFVLSPQGLGLPAWLFLSIFVGMVVGLILEPIPPAYMSLIGLVLAVFLKVGPPQSGDAAATVSSGAAINWGLGGFSNSTVWLIFAAFSIGLGYQQSGLGRRIALGLVQALGKKTLGLGYAIALTDGILAPFIPSNTARSGGVIYPIVSTIPPMFGSKPDENPRRIGAYLMWVSLAATCVTSSMFLTGLAPNLLAIETAAKSGVAKIEWVQWFVAFAPCGLILFVLTPLLAYWLYPPEVKGAGAEMERIKEEYAKLGPLQGRELAMIGISVLALVLWIFPDLGGLTGGLGEVNSTTVALVAICLMLAFRVFAWSDFLKNTAAWNVLMWFATLVTMAEGLKNVGFLEWLSGRMEAYLQGMSPTAALVGLVLAFYLIHYFFASTTAHVSALLMLFISIARAIPGVDVYQATVLMMLSLGVMGVLTPYGTGPSPVYFGSGYVKGPEFWRLGTIFGLVYLAVFLLVEIPWVTMVAKDWILPAVK